MSGTSGSRPASGASWVPTDEFVTESKGDRILGSDASRAVGRFRPDGPIGYRAKSLPNGPIRATRAEAERDEEAQHGCAPDTASAVLADARDYVAKNGCCSFCGAFIEPDGIAPCNATLDHPEWCEDAD